MANALRCVENPELERTYTIEFETTEFTALYAITAQPIFATISISYVPGDMCIEQMSLKMYLDAFRDEKMYYEEAINRIVNDLVVACDPITLTVIGDFSGSIIVLSISKNNFEFTVFSASSFNIISIEYFPSSRSLVLNE